MLIYKQVFLTRRFHVREDHRIYSHAAAPDFQAPAGLMPLPEEADQAKGQAGANTNTCPGVKRSETVVLWRRSVMAEKERFDLENEAESLGADAEYETRVEKCLKESVPKGNLRNALRILRGYYSYEVTASGGLRMVWREGKV